MLRLPVASLSLSLLVACGGTPTPAKTAPSNAASAEDPPIGDIAVASGGLASLSSNGGGATVGPGSLRAELVNPDNRVKLDGVLGEWPARARAGTVIRGSADRLSFAVAIQYDDRSLYVGGDVTDESFFRTERFGEGEDHASLLLAFPSGGALRGYEIGLFAGKPGETAGEVRFLGKHRGRVPGAKIVEAPAAKGYTFEAQIPWSAFPEARTVRVGLRGAARYYDSDGSSAARNVVGTAEGDASSAESLPPLLTEPEQAMADGLLQAKGLSTTTPKFDLIADVAGDAMKERIEVFDRFLTICGPGYRRGKEFFFRDLGADLVGLEARDLTGRSKADLVVRRRFADGGATREWFEVWSILGASDEPTTTFAHEVKVSRDGRHVDNTVRMSPRALDVGYEAASGWDASSYREPSAVDVEPILLPWGMVRTEEFRWDGSHFKKARTVAQAGVAAPASHERTQERGATALAEQPPTPPESAGGDLSRQLFDQYRRDRGVAGDVRPKFDMQVNVDGDARPERVVLIDRDIVVFGPGFKGGREYSVLRLQQFADPGDIRDLSARDLTGDGGADLVVRGVRHVSESSGSTDVDAFFVYRVNEGTIARVFGIETAREQGSRRVQGLVQFVPAPGGRGFVIDVRPGRATGWTKQNYPWAQDAPGSGPVEPLLLPWGGIGNLRYAWDGAQFSRVER
jgi:hypothetical protein